MNKYDTAFIKSYIEEHKNEISEVSCGMREDWFWTAETVYSDEALLDKYDWSGKSINVAGIDGSTWATPTMEVAFKDGRIELVPCFFDDGDKAPDEKVAQQKAFVEMTGGREYE